MKGLLKVVCCVEAPRVLGAAPNCQHVEMASRPSTGCASQHFAVLAVRSAPPHIATARLA